MRKEKGLRKEGAKIAKGRSRTKSRHSDKKDTAKKNSSQIQSVDKKELIQRKLKEWEENVLKKSLERMPERQEKFYATSGIEIPRFLPYYEPEGGLLSFPGEFPFTRGVQPTMYRARYWTMRQYSGFGTPEETNERFKFLLKEGQTGLSMAFDLPTQMGYDSSDEIAYPEVGKVGVAIDTVEDMRVVFRDIPLSKVSVSFTINATAPIILGMFYLVGQEQGVSPSQLRGTVQNDILKEFAARGTYIYPPDFSMKLVIDVIEFCAKEMKEFNPISVSGYHIREAGATAVQECAFAICSGIEYVSRAIERGLSPDDFGKRITFFFSVHNNFFEEIAKFRAARRVWSKIMRDRFGAKNPEAMKLKFHAQTSGVTLVAQEPINNIVRVAYQAMAAALGGAQSIHTNSYDEALALPTDESVKIALRTQQILAYETFIADTVDPLGGSYYVEYLTDEIEKRVWDYIKKVDELGGMKKAVEVGFIQREIARSSWEYQKLVEEKKILIVGVNSFRESNGAQKVKIFRLNEEAVRRKIEQLMRFKKERDEQAVVSSLRRLEDYARDGKTNLMYPIIECLRANCTLGEISRVFEKIYGRFKGFTFF
ncbi:Methylmalonyl-CoA mutase [bacterium HR19]|nr:Methylmalonyl-CoA mutase [bacterium HR19]